jgi:hypothetical protein
MLATVGALIRNGLGSRRTPREIERPLNSPIRVTCKKLVEVDNGIGNYCPIVVYPNNTVSVGGSLIDVNTKLVDQAPVQWGDYFRMCTLPNNRTAVLDGFSIVRIFHNTNLGDRLSDEQVSQMMGEVLASDEGNLDYKDFIRMMMSR